MTYSSYPLKYLIIIHTRKLDLIAGYTIIRDKKKMIVNLQDKTDTEFFNTISIMYYYK